MSSGVMESLSIIDMMVSSSLFSICSTHSSSTAQPGTFSRNFPKRYIVINGKYLLAFEGTGAPPPGGPYPGCLNFMKHVHCPAFHQEHRIPDYVEEVFRNT